MGNTIKCHCCDNDATVHLTQIVDKKMKKVDLCEDCAQAKGVTDPEGFSMADFHPDFEQDSSNEDGLVCESCGLTQKDFKKNGRAGCASCYAAFQQALDPMLESMHAGTRHTGRIPDDFKSLGSNVSLEPPERSSDEDIAALEKELTEAIEAEEYERAADIRDRIHQLKELAAG